MNSDPNKLRVAIVQYDMVRGDSLATFELIKALILDKASSEIDLFVLPEVCLTGFSGGAKVAAFSEKDPLVEAFSKLAEETGAYILGGFRIQDGSQSFNRALLFNESGIQARYDKQILFSYWKEHHLFSAGTKSVDFLIKGFHVAPFICYELRFPELFRAIAGAHVMPVIANWPSSRLHHWVTLLRARAIENQAYVIGVNRTGDVNDIRFPGNSVIIDPYGKPLLEMHHEEGCKFADLDLTSLLEYRKEFPVLEDAPTHL
jgi:omega-amidase